MPKSERWAADERSCAGGQARIASSSRPVRLSQLGVLKQMPMIHTRAQQSRGRQSRTTPVGFAIFASSARGNEGNDDVGFSLWMAQSEEKRRSPARQRVRSDAVQPAVGRDALTMALLPTILSGSHAAMVAMISYDKLTRSASSCRTPRA